MPKVPGMGNLNQLLTQMQDAAKQAQDMEHELAEMRLEASAGGDMVKVVVTGAGELVELKINPEAVDPEDVEMLEDLILTAVRSGYQKAQELRQKRVQDMLGGSGLNLPF